MQLALRARLPTIEQMACFSSKAYETSSAGDGGPSADQCPAAEFAGFVISSPYRVPWTDDRGQVHDIQYFVATNVQAKLQVIAVRGTQTDADVHIDLQIAKAWDKKLQVYVHSGFQLYAEKIYGDLNNTNKVLKPDYKKILTGHSLGGAVALLLGLYLYVDNPDDQINQGVYTFGQPRVFDNYGTTSWPDFSDRVVRVVDCDDPVPTVPTGDDLVNSVFAGTYLGNQEGAEYQHLGLQLILLNNGQYWMPGSVDLFRSRKTLADKTIDVLFQRQQTDHAIARYIARLQKLGPNGELAKPANPAARLQEICTIAPTARSNQPSHHFGAA